MVAIAEKPTSITEVSSSPQTNEYKPNILDAIEDSLREIELQIMENPSDEILPILHAECLNEFNYQAELRDPNRIIQRYAQKAQESLQRGDRRGIDKAQSERARAIHRLRKSDTIFIQHSG